MFYEKNIKEKVLELLKKADRIDIAVSYVVWSGLSLIYKELEKFGPDSRILITTEGMVTDPRSLEKLAGLNATTKVYAPNNNAKGFHLKTYLFETKESSTLLVGSSNISSRAFGLVHEMDVEIDSSSKGYIVEEYNQIFNVVSPFINVEIEKQAMEKIISSISNNFTVKTKLKEKFKNELYRYQEIPRLLYLYLNPNFNELDLLQLLFKNFYEPFENYYYEKYSIPKENKFIDNFFTVISQFVFRGYDNKTLSDYVKLLKSESINNELLKRVLLASDIPNGISTAINSNYNKKGNNYPNICILEDNDIYLNPEIYTKLKDLNALELLNEHLELFDYLSKTKEYKMKTFDLVDKGEFLFNVKSKDCYMNVVGERIDHDKKEVYCTIKITEKESHYDNYIIDNNKIVYYTQSSNTEEQANNKIKRFVEKNYKFNICAQFPHLGYTNTSYFNLGNVKINKIYEVEKRTDNKYNHKIEFILEQDLPEEFLQYKTNNN